VSARAGEWHEKNRCGRPKEARSRHHGSLKGVKLVGILGSNPRLRDRELKIDAAKPFRRWSQTTTIGDLRAFVHDVRTFVSDSKNEGFLEKIQALLKDSASFSEAKEADRAARV
jgi:hypothetical protein